jgi:hypothetical protein
MAKRLLSRNVMQRCLDMPEIPIASSTTGWLPPPTDHRYRTQLPIDEDSGQPVQETTGEFMQILNLGFRLYLWDFCREVFSDPRL